MQFHNPIVPDAYGRCPDSQIPSFTCFRGTPICTSPQGRPGHHSRVYQVYWLKVNQHIFRSTKPRSRPPLKPAANRKLAQKKEEVTVHDSLLSDIRGSAARQSLRKAPPRPPRPPPCVPPSPATARRLIELDASFADSILNFEESPKSAFEVGIHIGYYPKIRNAGKAWQKGSW